MSAIGFTICRVVMCLVLDLNGKYSPDNIVWLVDYWNSLTTQPHPAMQQRSMLQRNATLLCVEMKIRRSSIPSLSIIALSTINRNRSKTIGSMVVGDR